MDIDVLKIASPMWSFPGNLRMQGDSGRMLSQLIDAIKQKSTPAFRDKAAARLARVKAEHAAFLERAAKMATDKGRPGEINPHYLMAELQQGGFCIFPSVSGTPLDSLSLELKGKWSMT